MRTSGLDILEKAALPPAQAHAILRVMEQELALSHEPLATKAALDVRFSAIDVRFSAIDARFSAIDARFDVIEARLDTMATKEELQKLGSQLSWMMLGCHFTQLAFLAGAVYFLYAHPGR